MRYRNILGKNILKYRRDKDLSQEKLAELCNLHRTYIGAIERGERNIGLDNIEKISIALEIDLKKLFEDWKDDRFG